MMMSDEAPQLLQYDMGDAVLAFSTMRMGVGVSQGAYASFNINHYCGDDPQAVQTNRRFPCDAVMTDMADVCVGVSTADCIPVLLYDEDHHAVCAVHAGWRGTMARIVQCAVKTMQTVYQSIPERIKAAIGPGISITHFEVGDEVYQAFAEAGFDMDAIARRFKKWHIDLPLCNQMQLTETGVPEEQIHQAGICTYDSYDRFFSARRLGIRSGRIFTGIAMKV